MKNIKTREVILAGRALEKSMEMIVEGKDQCGCPFGELIMDFSEKEIDTIIKYQARVCALLSLDKPGGDIAGNHHLFMLARHRLDTGRDVLNAENLEEA